jgi:hypothetical protein
MPCTKLESWCPNFGTSIVVFIFLIPNYDLAHVIIRVNGLSSSSNCFAKTKTSPNQTRVTC